MGSDDRLDSALERLRHEYQELLSENRTLQGKCAAAQAQVATFPLGLSSGYNNHSCQLRILAYLGTLREGLVSLQHRESTTF